MKVAIVMPLAEQKGGAELLLLHLLKGNQQAIREEYGVAFLTNGPLPAQAQALASRVEVFPAGRLRQIHRYVATVFRLARWLRREKFDIVMSWMSMGHLYGSPASVLAGLPNVWWQHGFPGRSLIERLTAWAPSRGIFCCSAAVETAQGKLSPLSSRTVIHPAVDLQVFDPTSFPQPECARVRLGLPETGFIIGTVGRLQRWKGMDIFVESAAQVVKERSDVHFVIVGGAHALEPGYARELTDRVARSGLSTYITLAGFQRNPAEWMNACDIVVHASTAPEPFGMVILEAMALGKIVIASAAGGPLEIVEHGVNGYLSPPGNAAALAANILMVLSAGNFKSLREQARSTARLFSINHFAAKVSEEIRRVAGCKEVSDESPGTVAGKLQS